MSDTLLDTEEFERGWKKVGPGSEFRYRCIFDPTPVVKDETEPTGKQNDN